MRAYSSEEWYILNNVVLTSYMYWDTIVIDWTESKYTEWWETIYFLIKIVSHVNFDMHGDYVDHTILKDTKLYYFTTNKYDKY